MKEVDWSKAPEDATHYLPTDINRCWSACWYKQNSFGRWLGKNASNYDKGWNDGWAIDDDQVEAFVPTLIARPSNNWNGKGNPPIGTVCDIRFGHWNDWEEAKVLCIGEKMIFIRQVTRNGQTFEGSMNLDGIEFRPIKTQEQIAAEEREVSVVAMCEMTGSPRLLRRHAEELYDAGYRLIKTEE